jgi:pimeloyl-ACP methyl ester carboxylesterase
MNKNTKFNYAFVNGLKMYYEIHGEGFPLVILHGQFTTIEMFNKILPALAKIRKVIAVEQQGHGHTADIDRPLSFEQMADDTAALLKQLEIEKTDVFGYSTGGSVALQLAYRHPKLVRKLALSSTVYNTDGYYPQIKEAIQHPSPDAFPSEMREAYKKVAPNPKGWAALIEKGARQATEDKGLTPDEVHSIIVPSLVMVADGDIILPEHAEKLAGLLNTNLITLPNSDHASYIAEHPKTLLSKLTAFLNASVSGK